MLVSSLVLALWFSPIAPAQAPVGACSLLTKELALKVTSSPNKAVFDQLPPQEEKIPGGTSCDYGDIRIQVKGKQGEAYLKNFATWTPVPDVGDRALYRANRTRYAELLVLTGASTLEIQMGVPTGGTPEQVKVKAIELAKALVPKLK